MPRSTAAYDLLSRLLLELRWRQGVSQKALAERLGRSQSFVSNTEHNFRRLDVVEFCALVRALDADPVVTLAEYVKKLPPDFFEPDP